MIKKILCLFMFGICTTLFAENAVIHSVLVTDFLKDEKNVLRYQPLNMFDSYSDTVFAVTENKQLLSKPLINIYFAEPIEIDSLSIKAGYFDNRYFENNDRIKKITITVNNAKSTPIKNKSFILNDEMKIQKLDLSKTVKVTEIHITINEVYPGKKWNDLVISDLFFCKNSNNYSVTYGCNPDLSVSGEARYNRKFDSNGNLLSETLQEGKSGSAEITYEYNEYNQLICKKEIWDDPNNPEVKNYSYKTNKDKYPADTTIAYNSDGTIKTVTEKNWRGTKTYYFENNLCIAESVGKDFIIYQYKNMKKLFGIQVCSEYGYPMFQTLKYDSNNNIVEEVWYEHYSNWQYFNVDAY